MKSISTVLAILVPLIIYPYVARTIHADGIGRVNFAQSVVYYFTMIAQLGVPTYGIREVAKVRADKDQLSKTVKEILVINAVTCTISYILFFICMSFVPEMKSDRTLFAVMSLSTILQVIGVEWLYSGLEEYDRLTALSIVFKLLMVVGTFVMIKEETDYIWYGLMLVVGTSGFGVVNFITLKKVINLKINDKLSLKKHLKPIIVFFAMSVAVTIYTQMDSVMLGFMCGTIENGYYDAAVKIKMVLVSFITALGTVIMPRATTYIESNDEETFYALGNKALNFVVAMSIPFCVFCILFSSPAIHMLSGDGFNNSIIPMKIIMPTIILIGISNITGIQIMIPLGREKSVMCAEIIGAVVNLIVNTLLIPKLGASGAAIGTVIAELVVLLVEIYCLKDKISKLFYNIEWLIVIVATLLASLCSIWLMSTKLSEFVLLIIGGVIFFSVYSIIVLPKMLRKYRS